MGSMAVNCSIAIQRCGIDGCHSDLAMKQSQCGPRGTSGRALRITRACSPHDSFASNCSRQINFFSKMLNVFINSTCLSS